MGGITMYQQNKNNNGRKPFNKNQDRPKNKLYTFEIKLTGSTANGREYNIQSAVELLGDLNNFGTFSKLSVPVQINRSIIDNNPDLRGNVNIGYVKSIDTDTIAADVIVYSNCIERMEKAGDLVISPRMVVDRDENVVTILAFDLIKA